MDTREQLSLVKKIVHSVLVSSPEIMTIQKLSRDYKEMEGSEVPHRQFGHRDVETFLRSIPDVVTVIGSGPMALVHPLATAKSAHIQKFVSRQKIKSRKSKFHAGQKQTFLYNPKPSNLGFINESRMHNMHNYLQPIRNPNLDQRPHPPRHTLTAIQNQPPIRNPTRELAPSARFDSIVNSFNNLSLAKDDNVPTGEVKKQERTVTDEKQLPIESYRSDDHKVLPNVTVPEKDPVSEAKQLPTEPYSSDEHKALPNVSAPEEEPVVELGEPDRVVLELAKPKVAVSDVYDSSSDDCKDTDAFPAYAVDHRVLSVDYPRDAVRSDYKLSRLDLEKTLKVDERYCLQLVEVTDPHSFHFWIFDDYDLYHTLSHNIQKFYRDLASTTFTMPKYLLTPGHLCVVCPSNTSVWERAKIVSQRTDNVRKTIEVELIDTGIVDTVYKKDVKFLMEQFANMPPQGMEGRLAYVSPVKSLHWPSKVVSAFKHQVYNGRLFGKVEAIKNNIAYMVLVDEDYVNLNLSLIDSGLVRRRLTA
ncbi:GL10200 [Drosophila persimilis]|uniref:GL10200 n=1 Tax=Drosophila persimilis TaxID=7234 RepID=B4H516_DROPE|nr:GL10200 [Drosophila persimilis]